jgi:hypothetical protein
MIYPCACGIFLHVFGTFDKGLRDALGVLFFAALGLSREATGRPTGAWAQCLLTVGFQGATCCLLKSPER